MLGLGRALGETIAIALVIGASPQIVANLFAAGRGHAVGDRPQPQRVDRVTYQAALIGLGVVLFAVTMLVNCRCASRARGPHRASEGGA